MCLDLHLLNSRQYTFHSQTFRKLVDELQWFLNRTGVTAKNMEVDREEGAHAVLNRSQAEQEQVAPAGQCPGSAEM